jgi:hypothetical protein
MSARCRAPPNVKRLERLEQKLAEIATRESAANCNCGDFTRAAVAEFFEAEENQTCPVHGELLQLGFALKGLMRLSRLSHE